MKRPTTCARSLAITGLVAALAVALSLVPTRPLPAQTVDPQQWRHGYHGFAALARTLGLQVTDDARAWSQVDPASSLLVIFGDVSLSQLPIDPAAYLDAGGALILATDRGAQQYHASLGLDFIKGPLEAAIPSQDSFRFADCPVVRDFLQEHPVTEGVQTIVSNRPGALTLQDSFQGASWRAVARFPALKLRLLINGRPRFLRHTPDLAAVWSGPRGRAVALADQTIFTNQMLVHGDNARLAMNTLRWLNGSQREQVLIVANNSVLIPPPPLEVELPPPTPEEVKRALQNLPPDVLVEFVNSVLAGVEDDEVHNQFLAFVFDDFSWRDYCRLLVFLGTAVLGGIALREILPLGIATETVEGVVPVDRRENRRRQYGRERSFAARHLLEAFRAEFGAASDLSWKPFIRQITMVHRPWQTFRLRRRLRKMTRRLHPRYDRYWNRKRLAQLQTDVNQWRQWHRQGDLLVRTS